MVESKVYSAPSNIAIIKYMGKTSSQQNLPTNPSISYTLNHLRSFVTLTETDAEVDTWEPITGDGFLPIDLSETGKAKFLNHLKRIKELWGVNQNYSVRSANNFPSDCGIASSSSSFAALTLAAVTEFARANSKINAEVRGTDALSISKISRLGSGSSCRSFFSPWAIWETDGAQSWNGCFTDLHHTVMLLDSGRKEVSSSEAHLRVTTSPLFAQRLESVKNRLAKIEKANKEKDWNSFCDLSFEEFEEMHRLFETSQPHFSYRTEKTMDVLRQLESMNKDLKTKLLITMDAGNNIHCLSLSDKRNDLERLEALFPGVSFIHSWSYEENKNG